MRGWPRDRWLDETDVPWIQTSPAMPDLRTATVYPGMDCFEDQRFSIKHYRPHPFIWMAAPFINGGELAEALNKIKMPGVNFTPIEFEGREGRFRGKKLGGIQVNVIDRNKLAPVKMGVYIMHTVHKLYRDDYVLTNAKWPRRLGLREGLTPEALFESWEKPLREFKKARAKYLIYP